MKTIPGVATLALIGALTACDSPAPAGSAVRIDTLAGGGISRVYSERPELERWRLQERVRIGTADGPIEEALGDVRGLEVDADGSIIVLDYQANEVRRFDAAGSYVETIARRGDGPGEIGDANGLFRDIDGTLWINDHDHGNVTGLRADGTTTSVRMPVLSYGYLWSGTITRDGWTWDTRSASAGPARGPGELEPGVISTESIVSLVGTNLDQAGTTRQVDTVLIGRFASQAIYLERGFANIPYSPRFLTAIDPRGAVWTAQGDTYRLTKKDIRGDTLVVVELPSAAQPVTGEQRDQAIANIDDFMEQVGLVVPIDWDEILPTHHPAIDQLIVDDAGRVWAGRQGADGSSEYDVFSPDGEPIATVVSDLPFKRYFQPVVRGDSFLTMVTDELDVQYVVVATIIRDPG